MQGWYRKFRGAFSLAITPAFSFFAHDFTSRIIGELFTFSLQRPTVPLYPEAIPLIRRNLEKIVAGEKVPMIEIGELTDDQLSAINAERVLDELPPIEKKVLFVGRHLYKSRMKNNGYSIDEVLVQIESGMSEKSIYKVTAFMTGMQNPDARQDSNGQLVNDLVMFECSKNHPYPELISVIPKGDGRTPKKQESRQAAALVETSQTKDPLSSANSPG